MLISMMQKFVETVVVCSEVAANIARACRSEEALFHLLVEEKVGESRQKLTRSDFKTVADVLVQVAVRERLVREYPSLVSHVHGEEDDSVLIDDRRVSIRLTESEDDTARMLSRILNDETAAAALAAAVHQAVRTVPDSSLSDIGSLDIDTENIAVWIDPIDNTGAYIAGRNGTLNEYGIFNDSLQCVTVIIGVFDRSTGEPIVGVINQPFFDCRGATCWAGKCIWGVAYEDCFCNSLKTGLAQGPTTTGLSSLASAQDNMLLVLSQSELPSVVKLLSDRGFTIQYAGGAGYKLLCVIEGTACAYLVSTSSTFKWDTCGPHAILRSMGGNLLCLKNVVKKLPSHYHLIQYNRPDMGGLTAGQMWRNEGGVFAFANRQTLETVVDVLDPVVGDL